MVEGFRAERVGANPDTPPLAVVDWKDITTFADDHAFKYQYEYQY